MNRKLIRPDLTDVKERRHVGVTTPKYLRQRRSIPPDQTSAESHYYQKQMANRTRLVVMLQDGEEIRGVLEWYDRDTIKIHRPDSPNIMLFKHNVKYIYKENEEHGEDEEI